MEDLLAAAAQFVNTTESHIFLTGKAGTGKTTFLKSLSNLTHKSFIVVAPTGIAALNAGGVTIHSQFSLPWLTFLPDRFLPQGLIEGGRFINQQGLSRKYPINGTRKQVLRSIDLLVIDEVSMVRADMLDAIDYRMKSARDNFKDSFGGVQVLFIGDLYQLPPIIKNEEKVMLDRYYKTGWFYEAKVLEGYPLIYIELDQVFRQQDDSFISILNHLRNNEATIKDIETLNRHFKAADELTALKEVITLTTHNSKATEINRKQLKDLDGPVFVFKAQIEDEFPETIYPVLDQLELKIGAQIMFLRNDTEDQKYFNGKLATVSKLNGNEVWVEMAGSHEKYVLKRKRWENKKYTLNKKTNELEEEIIGVFEQYPIKLAWAITVHKSQGLTFEKAIIDVSQAFADGQVYVALSRLRSLDGLILSSKINPAGIRTDKNISTFVKAHHEPQTLGVVMFERQQQFVRSLLNKTYDLSNLIYEIQHTIKGNTSSEEFREATMKPVLEQLEDALVGEKKNTEKFRDQILALLVTGDHEQLLMRAGKGSAYYKQLLTKQLQILLPHLEEMKQQKRVKAYTNGLIDIDQAITKKLVAVDKATLLIRAILQGGNSFDFSPLATGRSLERNALLKEIGEKLAVKPGSAAVSKSKRKPKIKSAKNREQLPDKSRGTANTADISIDLLKSGLDVQQIATARELQISTIYGHLSKGVQDGRLTVELFLPQETVREISQVITGFVTDFQSKELYDKLNGKYDYGQIKSVMATLKGKV